MTSQEQELEALRKKLAPQAVEEFGQNTNLGLAEMNTLAERIATARDQKAVAEEALSKVTGELESLQKRAIDILVENQLTSYKAPAGLMSVTHHFTAKLPQGEDRVKCFDYLKSIGRWDDMASIHSQTFNSWVKEQYDLAKERGEGEPQLPGVTDVKTQLRISFRRAK